MKSIAVALLSTLLIAPSYSQVPKKADATTPTKATAPNSNDAVALWQQEPVSTVKAAQKWAYAFILVHRTRGPYRTHVIGPDAKSRPGGLPIVEMNAAGRAGWEAVGTTDDGVNTILILKHPVQ